MCKNQYLLPILFVLVACGQEPSPNAETVTYNIDSSRITVSGVSSGAYMAGQLHLAHSALFDGLAMVAGGPYYCAMNEISRGIGPCIKGGELGRDQLLGYAEGMAAAGRIDDLSNVRDDSVWLFHGALDNVVDQGPSDVAAEMYIDLAPDGAVTLLTDVRAVHGMPTLETGLACDTFGAPFLNACQFDAAGDLLNSLYGKLNERAEASGELHDIPQRGFDDADMLEHAYLYVPESCADGASCGVHVALHGCSQSAEYVMDAFAVGAGYNEWAESNNLLVLYPQVASSKIVPMNPYGCWDWWGYTGEDYATKSGAQIVVIKRTLDALAGVTL